VNDNQSVIDDGPARPSRIGIAARCAAVIFCSIAGSAAVKLLLQRILAVPQDVQWRGPFILAIILGLFWFAFAFLVQLRSRSNDDHSRRGSPPPTGTPTLLRTVVRALVIAGVLALTAWIGLYLNDEILESRSLPWIAPLITVQEFGIVKASQKFPCQLEGSDLGCEAYKWIPTLLAANTFFYLPFVLALSCLLNRLGKFRQTVRRSAHLFAWWCPVAVGIGLLALQVMHRLNLDTHDSLYPNPGVAHWHFGVWEQVDDITGTLITIAGLSLPFYFYRAIRLRHGLSERIRLAEVTSVSATMFAAVILGNVY
jgi:hypothetical protein